jgi:hypothetical protein
MLSNIDWHRHSMCSELVFICNALSFNSTNLTYPLQWPTQWEGTLYI